MKLGIRENWRIWLLVVFVVASSVAIFAPLGIGGPAGGDAGAANGTSGDAAVESTTSQYTNLRFGLDLAGGTQVRAPLVGMTVDGLQFDRDEAGTIEETLQTELGIGPGDVDASSADGTVEVFVDEDDGNVTQAEFAAALQAAGLDVDESDVRSGVTASTRQDAVDVLSNKIDRSGLSGGNVFQSASAGQERLIVIEVPGADRQEVLDLIGDRGLVQTVALYPVETNGSVEYRTDNLTTQDDFDNIGNAQVSDNGQPQVPVELREESAVEFQQAMQEYGFDRQGGTNCQYDRSRSFEENVEAFESAGVENRCLLTVRDGEVVFAASIRRDLSESFRTGTFANDPNYVTSARSIEEARELEVNLKAGALPTEMDLEDGTTRFLLPSLAQQFKPLSLLTGAAAIVAVSLMVFFRYRRADVAMPMILTAAAEVYVLLGFAAAVGLPLELSHIAGFIAVIGTGVDDLVIIADEIMQRGNIETSRVFESRFRKAFWVIGAAAATTIIAMSPLAVLSLGDLRGFAIVTIVGVLIGVLITRPAYGDILRVLVLRRD